MRDLRFDQWPPGHGVSTAFLIVLGLAASVSLGETVITVNTLNDVTDFGGAHQVGDLPGPDGRISMREAVLAANNTTGPQTIAFAIPTNEWWLYTDRAILRLEDGAFSLNDDATTIDFTTQTAFTGDTNPNGWEVGIYGLQPNAWGVSAIFVNGDDCVIKGLDRVMQRGFGVHVTGHDNRVIACSISGPLYAAVKVQGNVGAPATGNVIGGTTPEERNVLSGGNAGIRIDGPADGNVIIGNSLLGSPFAGIEVRGAYCCPEYTPYNTRIGGPTPDEANWIAGNGRFGEEGFPEGDQVKIEWAVGTLVEGNIIGTTQDGSAQYAPNRGTAGVFVRESSDTTIRDNLISGIRKEGVNHYAGDWFGVGVLLGGPNTGVVIQGNRIGTDAAGLEPVINLNGLSLSWLQGYPTDVLIGGDDSEVANIIAYSERTGITVAGGATGASILGNAIHSNGSLGIDLLPNAGGGSGGVTPNDPGDTDSGGNSLQNFPVLTSASTNGSSTEVTGSLNSAPNRTYVLEFFLNAECDASGFGEGELPLGRVEVTTDAAGDVAFETTLVGEVIEGDVITATATKIESGETSEFSACIEVTETVVPSDCDGDGDVDLTDFGCFLNCMTGPGGDVPPGCEMFDREPDQDVDFADLSAFQLAFTGG